MTNTRTLQSRPPTVTPQESEADEAGWSYVTGRRPYTVRAFEWTTRGGDVYLRYTDSSLPARDAAGAPLDRRRVIRADVEPLRDEKNRLVADRVRAAMASADRLHGRLVNGLPAIEAAPARVSATSQETVFGGFVLALDLERGTGLYATRTRRYDDMRCIRDRLFGLSRGLTGKHAARGGVAHPRHAEKSNRPGKPSSVPRRADVGAAVDAGALLATDLCWTDWNLLTARALWIRMAQLHLKGHGFGARRAEVFVDAIASVGSWLRNTGRLPANVGLLPKLWRSQLAEDWKSIVGRDISVSRGRHRATDLQRLHSAIRNGVEDPRVVLHARVGIANLHRAWRSWIRLDEDGGPVTLVLPPAGRRPEPAEFRLNSYQSAALAQALNQGYLENLERSYRDGTIADYPLLPAAVLFNGKAPVRQDLMPLSYPGIEPRIALVFDLAAEYRIGQGLRCRRSHLLRYFDEEGAYAVAEQVTHATHLQIPGNRRKPGARIRLSPEQLQHLIAVTSSGFLSQCEAHFAQGVLDDYPLVPSGRLVQGKAPPISDQTAMTRSTALHAFHELEMLSGIEPLEGRGWYGIRRKNIDLSHEYTDDAAVLNAAGGWTDSRTREAIYEDRESESIQRAAMEVRRQTRGEAAPSSALSRSRVRVVAPSADLPLRVSTAQRRKRLTAAG